MAKTNKRERRLIGEFVGVDDKGSEHSVCAYREGTTVKIEIFTDTLHSKTVHPQNVGRAGGIEREIGLCFNLKNIKRKPLR